jgi:FkbM family methyltransferase
MLGPFKELLKNSAKHLGLSISRFPPINDPPRMRKILMDEFHIDLVLDVGANEGQYAQQIREFGYTGRLISFEPLNAAFEKLKPLSERDSMWQIHNLGLGSEDGESKIHVDGVFSSILPLNHSHPTPEFWPTKMDNVESIRIARLDSVAGDIFHGGEQCWLKIDVQGFELKVLEGARQTLGKVKAIEVEVSLSEIYTGQAVMLDVLNFLKGYGFDAIHLEPCFSDMRRARTLQVDLILSSGNALPDGRKNLPAVV